MRDSSIAGAVASHAVALRNMSAAAGAVPCRQQAICWDIHPLNILARICVRCWGIDWAGCTKGTFLELLALR